MRHWPTWIAVVLVVGAVVFATMTRREAAPVAVDAVNPGSPSSAPPPGPTRADAAPAAAFLSLPGPPPARVAVEGSTRSTEPPLRAAIDYGRAQPVFIAARSPARARTRQRFTVNVTAESENDFARVAFTLEFDPRVLSVLSVRRGDLMSAPDASATLTYGVDPRSGRLSVQLDENEGGDPIIGGGDLCTVEFIAVAQGRSPLRIGDVAIGDSNKERVGASVVQSQGVEVTD